MYVGLGWAERLRLARQEGRENALALLDQHTPSLTDDDDIAISRAMSSDGDYADFAKRTCACGEKIDGFYEYVDHFKEVFRGEG